ncbi:PREDICTED: signal peptidase complex subunit 1 [Gavialis gangeticus]|uniref:signal peptidase complex subunit 1 n=1 Tax=Gavialis gangeticus TaxID=94835 RepID=UPI00092F9667|nr:PREDICTED: signal peptidase complex subunit 1 [Gavialis gangeticus]
MGRGRTSLFPASSAPALRSRIRGAAAVVTRSGRFSASAAPDALRPSSSQAGASNSAASFPPQAGSEAASSPRDGPSCSSVDEACVAAAMLDLLRSVPTQMDYKGQKLAEQIFQGIILVSAVIGFIYGYITEQFGWTVYIVMVGFALSCLLTLPPWPMYRRNPLKWLPVQELGPEDKKPADRKPKRHPK